MKNEKFDVLKTVRIHWSRQKGLDAYVIWDVWYINSEAVVKIQKGDFCLDRCTILYRTGFINIANTRVSILNAHHCMTHNLCSSSEYICLDIFQTCPRFVDFTIETQQQNVSRNEVQIRYCQYITPTLKIRTMMHFCFDTQSLIVVHNNVNCVTRQVYLYASQRKGIVFELYKCYRYMVSF